MLIKERGGDSNAKLDAKKWGDVVKRDIRPVNEAKEIS